VLSTLLLSLYFITVQDGKTALHLAAEHGHTNVVQLLIEAQADLDLQDKVHTFEKLTCHFP